MIRRLKLSNIQWNLTEKNLLVHTWLIVSSAWPRTSYPSWKRRLAHPMIDLLSNFSEMGFNMYLVYFYCSWTASFTPYLKNALLYHSKLNFRFKHVLLGLCRVAAWQNSISADDGIVFAEKIYFVCGVTSPPSCVLYLLLIRVFLGMEPRLVDLGHVDPWALQRCHTQRKRKWKKTNLTPKKLPSRLSSKTINLAKSTEFKATTVILC